MDVNSDRQRDTIFLVSTKKEVKNGLVIHVKNPADIKSFCNQTDSWSKAYNSRPCIAVVPNASVEYDAVLKRPVLLLLAQEVRPLI
jgi:hypothetical protein